MVAECVTCLGHLRAGDEPCVSLRAGIGSRSTYYFGRFILGDSYNAKRFGYANDFECCVSGGAV